MFFCPKESPSAYTASSRSNGGLCAGARFFATHHETLLSNVLNQSITQRETLAHPDDKSWIGSEPKSVKPDDQCFPSCTICAHRTDNTMLLNSEQTTVCVKFGKVAINYCFKWL